MDGLPSTRKEAKVLGSTRYFTGVSCKHGHVAKRDTSSGACVACSEQWRKDNPEKTHRWYKEHPEECKAQREAWAKARPDRAKAIRKKSNALNREKARESERRRRAADPDKVRARCANRRARRKGAEGHYTVADIAAIRLKQGGVCAKPGCGCRDNLTVDHILALTKGGSNWPSNLQLLCSSCNSVKGTRDNDLFMSEAA
jgi:5-methylcytosine-specific restriction endonuclease McrA